MHHESLPAVALIPLLGSWHEHAPIPGKWRVGRRRIGTCGRRCQSPRRRRLLCEPLEPRAMLSSTLSLIIADDSIAENAGSAATSALLYRTPAAAKVTANDGESGDRFGWSVSISDTTAIVGVRDDDDLGTNSGAAYIFEQLDGAWQQVTKLTADVGTDYADFGASVSISGTTAIVGAQWDDSACQNCGAAYIFEKSGVTWQQVAKLTANDAASMDAFGSEVAISGTTVIVGADMDDENGEDAGAAYIFERSDGMWTQVAKLTADDVPGAGFGGGNQSVAVSGNFVVLGSIGGAAGGSAYIFEKSGGSWTQAAKLTASDGRTGDAFGTSVSISGNTVLVGAPDDGDNGYLSGSAYVFELSDGTWWQAAKLLAEDVTPAADFLGYAVSLSGTTAIVGAWNCDTKGNMSGAAYIFENNDGIWKQAGKLLAPDGAAGDEFGRTVSISSSAAIVGAAADDVEGADSMGSAYISDPLTVSLSSSDPSEATTPATVTFLPGQASLSFPISAQDDSLLDGTQTVTITATATGFASDSDTLNVTDHETLSLVIADDSVSENAGAMATTATVTRSNIGPALTVQLANSDPSEAVAPATVVIPANQTSVTFGIDAVDDTELDGDRTVTLYASANGYMYTSNTLRVTDYETLSVVIAADSLSESGGSTTGTVTRNNTNRNSWLTVYLSVGDTSEASVQRTVSIPSGQASASFVVHSVDDVMMDGTQTVTVTASALGYIDGADTLDVTDDDVAGITIAAAGELITSETGDTAWFSIFLNTQPAAPVTIVLAGDTSEGTFPGSLIFTADNWDVPQIVTIGGLDDWLDDDDIEYTIQTVATSSDQNYQGIAGDPVIVTNTDDDTAGVTVTPSGGLRTNEAGGTSNFAVVLTSQPIADVTITLSSSDSSEGEVGPASLTFDAQNWSVPQTVTVTGVDDRLDDGDATFTVVTEPASSDGPDYDGFDSADVTIINEDDDTAGITVSTVSGNTSEAGEAVTFTIVLDSEPTAGVMIALSSSDVSEATVSPANISFTSTDWNTPQTVTVRGVDESLDDGDIAYSIVTASAVSNDPKYNGLETDDVSLTNTDDDTAGVTVGPLSGLATTEAGGTATLTVVLDSEPTADVTIAFTSGNTSEGTVWPASLTFTAGDWSAPQTVSVTGVDDYVDDGDVPLTVITSAVSSEDGSYGGMEVADVSLTNQDDDAVGVTVTESEGSTLVGETSITDTFSVVLDAEPASDVSIQVVCTDPGEVALDRIVLVFTPGTWSIAQIVTVAGVDDGIVDGDQSTTVILSVDDTNSDSQFVSLADRVVFVTTADNGYHGWQNQANRFDVDGNGEVSAQDVLYVINYINAHPGDSALPLAPQVAPPFYDVNGDGSCTPADVLQVVNHINSELVGQGESEAETSPLRQVAFEDVWLTATRLPSRRLGRIESLSADQSTTREKRFAIPTTDRGIDCEQWERSQKVQFSDLTAAAWTNKANEFDSTLAGLENVLACIAEDLSRR